ncbi:MAG: hypothetical protein IT383_13560 [Deltaproteobacteria bacterium]|nr:hypothetical protein [Deltaproteobacteria bacterium]
MLATTLLALVATQHSPTLGLAVQPAVGLSLEEVAAIVGRMRDELDAVGVSAVAAAPVDAACTPDPACLEGARTSVSPPTDGLLVVELLRIGPVVQVTATATAGEQRAAGTVSLDEAQLASGPVVPAEITAWAKTLAPAPPPVVAPVTEAPTTFELTPMKSGALFAGGVGVIAFGAGVALVATSEPVLEDPKSLGSAKEQARTLGLVGLGATVLGLAGMGAAAGMWFIE